MGIKYSFTVRTLDSKATADEMQECADGYRDDYMAIEPGTDAYRTLVSDAAYCQSLADRKRQEEGVTDVSGDRPSRYR